MLLVVTVTLSGCRTTHIVEADGNGAPRYDQLTIVYEVCEAGLPGDSSWAVEEAQPPVALSYAKSHPLRAALVSRETFQAPEPALKVRLIIESPHPQGSADSARVTLVALERETASRQVLAQQTISRTEVDLIFVHLAGGGVCDEQSRLEGHARIAVEVDGHCIQKPWTREPRLDRLAAETYDAGGDS